MGNNYIKENQQVSAPISGDDLKRYFKKEDAICKLITGLGTGFFCETKIKNKKMKFLFTCNHVLDEQKIKIGSKIQILHKNETKNIKIKNNTFVCTNEELDYTCIEIFDNENFNNYFKIDPEINCNDPNKEYKDDKLVIIQYPGNNNVSYAEGKIIEINDNLLIKHSVSTEHGSSGSPIILSNRNLNIIGIHQGSMEIYNRGVYIKNVLDDIEKQYLNKKTNLGNKKENIKIILFGDSGVGKTSIINQFVNGGFNDETLMTITQYKLIKEIKLLNEKKIKLEIWDYPGIESYRNLFQIFIKKINIVLLIYNINNKVTFDNLDIWYKMADEIIGKDNVIFCVIGNDIDLYENHIVDSEIGKEYAKKINALFFEINTRDHESVENIFIQIINEYYGLSNKLIYEKKNEKDL